MSDTATGDKVGGHRPLVEVHSIDYIPMAERHGKARDQFTLWFASDAELATLAVGLIGITLGLSLPWTLVAAFVGLGFGTFFMAFHSVQGPRMGIPQMLQSRPQFGYYGALLPQAIAVLLFVGFNVFNTIIAATALHAVISIAVPVTVVIAALGGLLFAYGGYDWIHFIQRWGTYIFVVLGGVFTVGVLFTVHLPAVTGGGFGRFMLTPFLVVFVAAAAYQISSAPYVSDYSRYLDRKVTARQCFLWTYAGAMVGAFWMIALGGLLLAAHPTAQTVSVVGIAGNHILSGFGSVILVLGFLMLLGTVALNMYSGSEALLAMVDTVKRVKPRLIFRVSTVLLITVLATAGALALPANFLTAYSNFLTILLYFLIPWTAVNLVDFYLVRRGRYAVMEIFKVNGIYGRWQWRGLWAYALGFCLMIPFMSTAVFTGPVANALHGADLSVFVGLPVAAGFYYLFSRDLEIIQEHILADSNAQELEELRAEPDTGFGSAPGS